MYLTSGIAKLFEKVFVSERGVIKMTRGRIIDRKRLIVGLAVVTCLREIFVTKESATVHLMLVVVDFSLALH